MASSGGCWTGFNHHFGRGLLHLHHRDRWSRRWRGDIHSAGGLTHDNGATGATSEYQGENEDTQCAEQESLPFHNTTFSWPEMSEDFVLFRF